MAPSTLVPIASRIVPSEVATPSLKVFAPSLSASLAEVIPVRACSRTAESPSLPLSIAALIWASKVSTADVTLALRDSI